MVYRIFVEKKPAYAHEAKALLEDVRSFLGITALTDVRIFNRYDAENISLELFGYAQKTVFSEPQVDITYSEQPDNDAYMFAVEYLPGQFDQRADSAAQCIQILSQGERPLIASAKVYALYGRLTEENIASIKRYVINPVEAREASMDVPKTLAMVYDTPADTELLEGFCALSEDGLSAFVSAYGLAMDVDDAAFCQRYFRDEGRDPTITEIRMIDTYWSDHCRHTTFQTIIDDVTFTDPFIQKAYRHYLSVRQQLGRTKPICLMDIATLAVKYLRKEGKLDKLDESEEINACTVKFEMEHDGVKEPWLLLFKNETHNHPTEIEPFGGAATCIGGAIRDPLSGRAYVYGAMRLTGAADPRTPLEQTISGKLPQRKIVTGAASGYSSYGNQIGLATGIVDELYHPGYAAKRMEIGAVIGAAPQNHVRREVPLPGDVVILLGGATGRDGIGGATGSSKAHNAHSVEQCGAEVQKGNAPEERKLQRLFRNGDACRMIKRCNDFGAGGVSVAIGELADGLSIDLSAVPKKYEGLTGTELAISESQERMAVVVAKEDVEAFLRLSDEENLNAVPVAEITEQKRLKMTWNGKTIVDISREFLNSNGAPKHIDIVAAGVETFEKNVPKHFSEGFFAMVSDLNCCSKRGLAERFDSTIGAGTVLMPFGGIHQKTPAQAMVQKISVEKGHTDLCSLMAWGYNPFITEKSPYHGAYLAVVESVCKLVASGAAFEDVYLTFQEYFEKPGKDPKRWGKPLSALLGAFEAQMQLGLGAIGGKDSMSGSFETMDVPPTLVSFAVTTEEEKHIISPEFKAAGHRVFLLSPSLRADGLPDTASLLSLFHKVASLVRKQKITACRAVGFGGVAEAVYKMCLGNGFGFAFEEAVSLETLFSYQYGSFVVETEDDVEGILLGITTDEEVLSFRGETVLLAALSERYESVLEDVYPMQTEQKTIGTTAFSHVANKPFSPHIKTCRPRVLIPVFPGTNCEYDSAKAVIDAGAEADVMVINNLTAEGIERSVLRFAQKIKSSQIIFIPGGFSGGDEPDGSGKFITAFFRNDAIKEGVEELLNKRDGLMCGICNGFQALIKLGLVPYGKIIDPDETSPTITFNTIGRHQSKIVRTRIASNLSPWLSYTTVGEVYSVPISHGEGRFVADEEMIARLAQNGQIATQYVDIEGRISDDIQTVPNGSMYAIEGITSPDGRVFGKMGHSERIGKGLYKNVPGQYDIRMFEAAVKYFR